MYYQSLSYSYSKRITIAVTDIYGQNTISVPSDYELTGEFRPALFDELYISKFDGSIAINHSSMELIDEPRLIVRKKRLPDCKWYSTSSYRNVNKFIERHFANKNYDEQMAISEELRVMLTQVARQTEITTTEFPRGEGS